MICSLNEWERERCAGRYTGETDGFYCIIAGYYSSTCTDFVGISTAEGKSKWVNNHFPHKLLVIIARGVGIRVNVTVFTGLALLADEFIMSGLNCTYGGDIPRGREGCAHTHFRLGVMHRVFKAP